MQLSKKHKPIMYFRDYGLQKTWLVKCLNRLVSENLFRVNLLGRRKNC